MGYLSNLSELEVNLLIDLISESIEDELSQYEELDFYDGFVFLFRKWMNENLSEDQKNYPFSLLSKKYGDKFARDILGDSYNTYYSNDRPFNANYWDIRHFMQLVIRKGLHKLPSARKQEKFTEKYKKALDVFIKKLKIPDFVKLEVNEKNPYDLFIKYIIDYPTYLKNKDNFPRSYGFSKKLSDFVSDYLGIPIGSPINGELRITVDEKMVNVDEWINNVFKKDIKKQIKSLPDTNRIKKMVFTPSKNDMSTLKFYFQDFTSYEMKREIRQKVDDLLDSLGYEKIRVEIPY